MNLVLTAAALLTAVDATSATGGDAREAVQAAAATRRLESWRADHAETAKRPLHIVCWTPSDREFPAGYRERLGRILLHVQAFYAREMERHGFGELTFGLERDGDGVVLHEILGRYPTDRYGKDSGRAIRDECEATLAKAGIDVDDATIAIFCNLAQWDEQALRFTHESPYYASGDHRRGTAWQLDSPELDTRNLPLREPMIRDGQYGRISLGKHNSIFIGGIAHELGHAFGLPHCKERPDEAVRGTALMGSGNRTYGDELRDEGRGTFLTFAHALRLASHPSFVVAIETRRQSAASAVSGLDVHAEGKAIAVSGVVAGEPTVYGVVAYFDPEGHGDYDQTSMTAIPDEAGRFALRCDALVPGSGTLSLIPLHANGAIADRATLASMRFAYRVADDGTPDLTSVATRLALRPAVDALARRDTRSARELAAGIDDERAREIAMALTSRVEPTQTPATYDGAADVVSLTSLAPEDASVGWMRPVYDRLPDASVLLESGGELFARGIYAHAPARHVYTLDGNWETLSGKAGLAAGHSGSVRFTIEGDGKELWNSSTVAPDRVVSFEVPVAGVQRLELIVSPTDDGNADDWGLWLAPELRR